MQAFERRMNTAIQTLAHVPWSVSAPLILLPLIYLAYRSALPRPLPDIPYDKDAAKSLLGDISQITAHMKKTGRVTTWFTTRNETFNSPVVQLLGVPFSKPALIVSDYQESQDILLRRAKEFDRSKRTASGFAGVIPNHHIAMKTADPRFKGNREFVRDLMSPSFLRDVSAAQIYAKTLTLVELWDFKTEAANGRPFHALEDIFGVAMDIVNAAAFALDDSLSVTKGHLQTLMSGEALPLQVDSNGQIEFPHSPAAEDVAALQAVTHYLGEQLMAPFPALMHRYRMLTDATLRRQFARKEEVIIREIQKAVEKGNSDQQSAVDYIVQREVKVARKEGRSPDFFSRRTIDELFGYVIAGHETSSSALSWMVKLLADHQDVQHKLREELHTSLSLALSESRQPTVSEITDTRIPYLDAFIDESLRFAAPIPVQLRQATVDTEILGHKISKGTNVFLIVSGPSILRLSLPVEESRRSETSRTKAWGTSWSQDDITLFRPERWLKNDDSGDTVHDPQSGPMLSFSLGPRGCFGKRLAYVEIRIVLTLLIWNFQFKKLEDKLSSYETTEGITIQPKFCYVGLDRTQN